MRQIKFRGKSDGKWVYGSLHIDTVGKKTVCYIIDENHTHHVIDDGEAFQYTGVLDGNGVEIYEGAIVQWSMGLGKVVGVIAWEPQAAAFYFKWKSVMGHNHKELAAVKGTKHYSIDYFEVLPDGHPDLFTGSAAMKTVPIKQDEVVKGFMELQGTGRGYKSTVLVNIQQNQRGSYITLRKSGGKGYHFSDEELMLNNDVDRGDIVMVELLLSGETILIETNTSF